MGSLAAVKALAVKVLSYGCVFYTGVCAMQWRLVIGIRQLGMLMHIWRG